MVTHLSCRELRLHLAAMIQSQVPLLDSKLALVRSGQSIQEVLHYFRRQLPGVEQWTIMLEQNGERIVYNNTWPATSKTIYDISIWGVGQVEDDQHRDDITAELAMMLKTYINSRHASTEIEPGKWLYFGEQPPINEVSFGVPNFGDSKTGAFVLRFVGNCDIVDEETRRQSELGRFP